MANKNATTLSSTASSAISDSVITKNTESLSDSPISGEFAWDNWVTTWANETRTWDEIASESIKAVYSKTNATLS